MLKKYSVEYRLQFRKHSPPEHHMFYTDDPLTCEGFVQELLDKNMGIHAILHDGVALPTHEFDRLVKVAAGALASQRICASLHIKPEEERHRFGFAA